MSRPSLFHSICAFTFTAVGVTVGIAAGMAEANDGPKLRPIPEPQALQKVEPAAAKPTIQPLPSPKAGTLGGAKAPVQNKAAEKSTEKTAEKPAEKKVTKTVEKTTEKTAAKTVKTAKTTVKRSGMVPPPPPNTVTMLSTSTMMGMGLPMMGLGMDVDFLSKDALKDRAREVSIQYRDALAELESKRAGKKEREERARNFEGLFAEGVVSRRELENSQKEAKESVEELQRLENRFSEVKNLNDRINKRLAFFSAKPVKPLKTVTTTKKKVKSAH